MKECPKCGQPLQKEGRLDRHVHVVGGAEVELIDSASRVRCEGCGETAVIIPNLSGLFAAVALCRALQPMKLSGPEIRFVRKAAGYRANELAKVLNVSAEAVSRWEGGSQPMSPQNEIMFRFIVVANLKDQAPAVDVELQDVIKIKLTPFRYGDNGEPMKFELVKLKREGKSAPHWDTTDDLAAA